MEFEWTDWIDHIPGQRLPAGFFVEMEFQGYSRNGGRPYTKTGRTPTNSSRHPQWSVSTIDDPMWVLIRRYRLRIEKQKEQISTDVSVPMTGQLAGA